jgi:hypothetical protein
MVCCKETSWDVLKRPLVQILVVVANIKERLFKTEVGKGSLGTVVDQGLVDPKLYGNSNANDGLMACHYLR